MDPVVIVSLVQKKIEASKRALSALEVIRYAAYLTGSDSQKFVYVMQRVTDSCAHLLEPRVLAHLEFLVHENLAELIAEEMQEAVRPRCCCGIL